MPILCFNRVTIFYNNLRFYALWVSCTYGTVPESFCVKIRTILNNVIHRKPRITDVYRIPYVNQRIIIKIYANSKYLCNVNQPFWQIEQRWEFELRITNYHLIVTMVDYSLNCMELFTTD